jgi:hypothetical protein
LVAIRSRGGGVLSTVPHIDDEHCPRRTAMTRHLAAQAVSLALSVLVTIATLAALDGLAGSRHASAQQVAAAASTRA